MVKKFRKIYGHSIEYINGQTRLAYALTRTEDFYDVANWVSDDVYPGAQIVFYDLSDGEVYVPFSNKPNVTYGKPLYYDDAIFFLKGDFDNDSISLLHYVPGKTVEETAVFEMELFLSHVDSQGTVFRSNHASNYLTLAGTLNQDIPTMLAKIRKIRDANYYRSEEMRRL